MSTGGATWGTAGVLEVGGTNTFDTDDATENHPIGLHGVAWWTFTPDYTGQAIIEAGPSDYSIGQAFYTGEVGSPTLQNAVDFIGDAAVYEVIEGRAYHLVVGNIASVDFPPTYSVAYSVGTVLNAVSHWIDTLRDAEYNKVIASPGLLKEINAAHSFASDPDWFTEVFDICESNREGHYTAFQVLSGASTTTATGCVVGHARYGDDDNQTWNLDWGNPDDHSDPVCKGMPPGVEATRYGGGVHHSLIYAPPTIHAGDALIAAIGSAGIGIRILPFKRHLTERGILPTPDPEADGYPAGSLIEYEGELELVSVEFAIDNAADVSDPDHPVGGMEDDPNGDLTIDVNAYIRPNWADGDWTGTWPLGGPPGALPTEVMADGVTSKPHYVAVMQEADVPWHEYEGLDDWVKCYDPDAAEEPDFIVSLWTSGGYGSGSTLDFGDDVSNGNGVAVRVTVRSPRYRWHYAGPAVQPVIRQYPRDDGRGISSAPRLYPPVKAQRLAGGYQ